jgi:hypothetical protein
MVQIISVNSFMHMQYSDNQCTCSQPISSFIATFSRGTRTTDLISKAYNCLGLSATFIRVRPHILRCYIHRCQFLWKWHPVYRTLPSGVQHPQRTSTDDLATKGELADQTVRFPGEDSGFHPCDGKQFSVTVNLIC